MKQESSITRRLTEAQEQHANRTTAPAFNASKTLYRLYTEHVLSESRLAEIIGRYFEGATITYGTGLDARTQSASENAVIVEIVSSKEDALQRVLNLAGDLRVAGRQISVLVTQQPVTTFEVTEPVTVRSTPTVTPTVTDSPTINLKSKAQAHRFSGIA